MGNNYRIGMLIGRFHPVRGGAEIQCLRLSKQLKKANKDVFILTQSLPGIKSEEIIEGIPVYRLGMPWKGRFGSLTFVISGFVWLCFNLKHFEILHAHLASSPAVLAGIISLIFKKPSVLKFGGSRATGDITTSCSTWYGRLKLVFLRNVINLFVCPSNEIMRELLKTGFPQDKISVIPNGIDTSLFKPAGMEEKKRLRQALGLPAMSKIVIYTGRLEQGKGLNVLLKAWEKLAENQNKPDAYLIILGSGSLKEGFQKEYANLNSIMFCGWKENIADYLRASDIFVLPSLGEGLPNSLIEAMSCGLACISTKIGGVIELITCEENGILVNPGNAQELNTEMLKLIYDPAKICSIGKKARLFAERNISIDNICSKYITLYDRLRVNFNNG